MEIKGKVIYSPKGKAKEYAENAANFYVGCSIGCDYCFLRKGRGKKILGGSRPELKLSLRKPPYAIDIFKNELLANKEILQKTGLFFSFTTDPLLPETERLTRQAVGVCQRASVPVKILTKSAQGIDRFIEFANASEAWDNSQIALGATLTGCDDLEPNADSNFHRTNSLWLAKMSGFKTFASVEPIPPGRFFDALSIISESLPYVDLYNIGLQSGEMGNYEKGSILLFMTAVSKCFETMELVPKLYWKDSIMSLSGITRDELPDYCVPANYNLFNTK